MVHFNIVKFLWSVTTDGFWIDVQIYWTLDTARDYTLQFNITHTLVSTVTSSLPLLGSGFQRRIFTVWVPELSPASTTSFSEQQLND
jgi:hypothetical protein